MVHPLVQQLFFTRREWQRALDGVSDADAARRLGPMNSIGWIVGHLAWQEQRYWLTRAQGCTPLPRLNDLAAYGRAPTTPALNEMWVAWHAVTRAADPYLQALTTERLRVPLVPDDVAIPDSVGTFLQRVIYHYWYHIGESAAIRQLLGHTDLPEFVGDIHEGAPFRPA